MHLDAIDLKDFYASPLGAVVRRLLGARVRARWSNLQGKSLFGLGFATPYLGAFRNDAGPIGALMPAELGVMSWPREGKGLSVLVDETELPLPDECADRILLVHMLEWSERTRALLRELWRVLAPNGRLLIIVPNRRGLWARVELHALRPRSPVQPLADRDTAQGRNVLSRGLAIRALHAALLLARPAQMARVLGAARPRSVACLLRRDPGRSDEADLCRGAGEGGAEQEPPRSARTCRSSRRLSRQQKHRLLAEQVLGKERHGDAKLRARRVERHHALDLGAGIPA